MRHSASLFSTFKPCDLLRLTPNAAQARPTTTPYAY
jgi:hypothetical protein